MLSSLSSRRRIFAREPLVKIYLSRDLGFWIRRPEKASSRAAIASLYSQTTRATSLDGSDRRG